MGNSQDTKTNNDPMPASRVTGFRPGDLLLWSDPIYHHDRLYEVIGIHLGGEESESLIELRSFTEKPGSAKGFIMTTTMVPEPLTRDLTVFRRANMRTLADGPDARAQNFRREQGEKNQWWMS